MTAYFDIMRHKWNLSKKVGYEIPMDEAVLDWAMQQAEIGKLGTVDPAELATWWRERESVAQVLEPQLIESEALEPLLSSGERPLVKLPQPELDQKLTGILEQNHASHEHQFPHEAES